MFRERARVVGNEIDAIGELGLVYFSSSACLVKVSESTRLAPYFQRLLLLPRSCNERSQPCAGQEHEVDGQLIEKWASRNAIAAPPTRARPRGSASNPEPGNNAGWSAPDQGEPYPPSSPHIKPIPSPIVGPSIPICSVVTGTIT